MKLAIPLAESQVVAAGRVHAMLQDWKSADRVLGYLAATLPRNTDYDQVLLKAAALNQLYGTNVRYLHAMGRHIAQVFSSQPPYQDECSLVEWVADLEASGKQHESFASKYCHFFVDNRRFPLYDRYARETVRLHLGRGNYRCKHTSQTYRNFHSDLSSLRAQLGFHPSIRELDHYLWLRAQWQAYDAGKRLGAEVSGLFERSGRDSSIRLLVDAMCGGPRRSGL